MLFKHSFKVAASNPLKGSDQKRLLATIHDLYPEVDAAELDALMPAARGKLTAHKLHASHTVIYSSGIDNQPLFLDVQGHLLPTVYALWRAPSLIPTRILVHPLVSKYILQGADVMFPGVTGDLPSFQRGDVCAVYIKGNPFALCVGTTVRSSEEALAGGLRGKGVEVLHRYGDHLWSFGDSNSPPGFHRAYVLSIEDTSSGEHDEEAPEEWELALEDPETNVCAGGATVDLARQAEKLQVSDTAGVEQGADLGDGDGGTTGALGGPSSSASAAVPSEVASISKEEMDELLDISVLRALAFKLKDADLPTRGSQFYSNMVMPCRPVGTFLDVKKSNYRKVNNLLKKFKDQRVIFIKQLKGAGGDCEIIRVDRKHGKFQLVVGDDPASFAGAQEETEGLASGSGVDKNAGVPLEVINLYRPRKNVHALFPISRMDRHKLYSMEEIQQCVLEYAHSRDLLTPNGEIALDPFLEELMRGEIMLSAEEIVEQLLRRFMDEYFAVAKRNEEGELEPVEQPKRRMPGKIIVKSVDRQGGRKHTTTVEGLEPWGISLTDLAKELSKRFAAAATIKDLPGKNNGQVVVCQGDIVPEVSEYLMEHCGVPQESIEAPTKGGKAGKRGKGRR